MLNSRSNSKSPSIFSAKTFVCVGVCVFFGLFVFGVDLFELMSGNLDRCSELQKVFASEEALLVHSGVDKVIDSCQFDLPCDTSIESGVYRQLPHDTTAKHVNTSTLALPAGVSSLHCAYLCCDAEWCSAWSFFVAFDRRAYCSLFGESATRHTVPIDARQANVGSLFAAGVLVGRRNPMYSEKQSTKPLPIDLLG
jgi:hypothetical protein